MRRTRIYFPSSLTNNTNVELEGDRVHYLKNVMRVQAGQQLLLFNASDGEFLAEVIAINRSSISISLGEQQRVLEPSPLQIELGLGLSRGDRMDYGLQKSTELGVTSITPLLCEFSEAKLKPERLENRMRHWQGLLTSASEQSGRLDVPQLNAPAAISDWFSSPQGGETFLFHPGGVDELPAALKGSRVRVLIGPEGGFSDAEVESARASGVLVSGLGPRILRTETAPVVALSLLQFRYGDMAIKA